MPLEWNLVVVYGGFALFQSHPDIAVWHMGAVPGVIVLLSAFVVPILGNLFPHRVSFLPAMRYYAGNWGMGIWLFKGESHRKLHAKMGAYVSV